MMRPGLGSLPVPVTASLSLLLLAGMGILAIGLGEVLLKLLGVRTGSNSERVALSGGLGLGALAYGLLGLGLAGWLQPGPLIAFLVLVVAAAWSGFGRFRGYGAAIPTALGKQSFFERLASMLVAAMLGLVLVRGLAPVTDYDGLTYHLVVPRRYWQAGGIVAYPGESHSNFPLAVDLLYLPSVALGLESGAKLVHLGFGVLMGIGVYALAKRVLKSRRGGWLSVFVLATAPVLGTVGGYAHTDLGWALFEFLSAFALLRWCEEENLAWLLLGGIYAGLGLGSKYLGLPVLGVLGLVVLTQTALVGSSRGGLFRVGTLKRVLRNGLLFGLIAVAVGSPWYVKNWLCLGNPFYPLWFGGRGWDAYQAANLSHLGTRYGPRQGVLGALLLPWDLFFRSIGHFGPIPFAFPPPFSLLLPTYLVVRRRKVVNVILLIAGLRFLTWAASARNARYLIDIFPLLSIAAAYVLSELSRREVLRAVLRGMLFLLLVANLVWQSSLLLNEGSIPVVLGMESREAHLADHNDPPYRAVRFINTLPPGSRVFFVGSGQSYYVTTDHQADVNHANWGHLVYRHGEEPEDLLQALHSQGFTHVYFSGYDFVWQMSFEGQGQLERELALFEAFTAECARLVYDAGPDGQVYALLETCREERTRWAPARG